MDFLACTATFFPFFVILSWQTSNFVSFFPALCRCGFWVFRHFHASLQLRQGEGQDAKKEPTLF